MGSNESKIEQLPKQENEIKETIINESVPSTPILTPIDPRSPSENIARTPLEVILGVKGKETTVDKIESDEEITKEVVNFILGTDPRSPTVEFNRTPIIIETVCKEKPTKLKNKNFNNVLKNEIQTTPVAATRKCANIIPPKLLETSPVTIVSNYSNKRKSFVGLLETNIDYTETDLDTVCQNMESLNKTLPVELSEDIPCNKLQDQMEVLQGASLEKNPEITELDSNESKLELTKIKDDSDVKLINITAQVRDFDKKLTNLIYQDDSDDDKLNLRVVKIKENNRTPLSVRNSNEDSKKMQNRLKVRDKPRKSDSRIPVLRNNINKKVGVQCENTPPSKMETNKFKTKVSHWDADKTLII